MNVSKNLPISGSTPDGVGIYSTVDAMGTLKVYIRSEQVEIKSARLLVGMHIWIRGTEFVVVDFWEKVPVVRKHVNVSGYTRATPMTALILDLNTHKVQFAGFRAFPVSFFGWDNMRQHVKSTALELSRTGLQELLIWNVETDVIYRAKEDGGSFQMTLADTTSTRLGLDQIRQKLLES